MTFGKWTPTLEAIDKLQLEMYAKKEIIKELEKVPCNCEQLVRYGDAICIKTEECYRCKRLRELKQ
jgi:hypothetical protein